MWVPSRHPAGSQLVYQKQKLFFSWWHSASYLYAIFHQLMDSILIND